MAQTVPSPVPEAEVFKREEIGHALSAPTPEAGNTAASAANAPTDDGQWTMPSKNYASTRFSSLAEITAGQCALAARRCSASRWRSTRGRRRRRSWRTTRMYIVTAYPNYRLRARPDQARRAAQMEVRAEAGAGQPGRGVLRRRQSRRHRDATESTFSPPWTARPSRSTSRPANRVWRTQLGNINKGETITMAPTVADGKVYVGNSGGELGVRGWVDRAR